MFKYFILFICLIVATNGQRLVPGTCPNIATENNFDAHKFFGHWIETERTPSIFDFVLRCMEVDYANEKDGTLSINLKGVSFAGLPITIKGDGVIHDTYKNGHYNVRYAFGVPFQGTVLSVVDTDYSEYAVLYSCTNSLFPRLLHSEHIWILTRNGVLSNPSRQNIYTKLDQFKINRNGLTLSDRTGCPFAAGSTTTREEESKNSFNLTSVKSNLTNLDNNNLLNVNLREELATESPVKTN